MSANIARTVVVGRGAPSTGNALAQTQLAAANPQASVTCGSYGTVTLASLLNTSALVVTEHAGPVYAAFQYVANFPGDSRVHAVFYAQLWDTGPYRIRVAVKNGTALAISASKSGSATISVGGSTVYSGSVSMPQGTR